MLAENNKKHCSLNISSFMRHIFHSSITLAIKAHPRAIHENPELSLTVKTILAEWPLQYNVIAHKLPLLEWECSFMCHVSSQWLLKATAGVKVALVSISCLYDCLIGDHNTDMTQFITQMEGSVRCSVKKYSCVIEL